MWGSKGFEITGRNLHGSLGSWEWGQEFVRRLKGFRIIGKSPHGNFGSQDRGRESMQGSKGFEIAGKSSWRNLGCQDWGQESAWGSNGPKMVSMNLHRNSRSWEWGKKSAQGQFDNLGYELLLQLAIHLVFTKVQMKVYTRVMSLRKNPNVSAKRESKILKVGGY